MNLASLFIQSADAGIGDDALENARNALLQAIKIKSSAIAYCLLGSVDFKAGKYEDAEQNLKQALTIQSHMVAARLMLANLYLRQEKWDAALQQLDSYLQENPLATDYDQVKKMRDRLSANK